MLSVTFKVDPSETLIKDQHFALAQYLRDRYLNVDIYDSDSHFLYGTIKLPLYELLRQQSPLVKRVKEADVGAPDSPEVRGAFAIIMQNQGETERVTMR